MFRLAPIGSNDGLGPLRLEIALSRVAVTSKIRVSLSLFNSDCTIKKK